MMSPEKSKKSGKKNNFQFYKPVQSESMPLKVYANKIPAGFPSPADDFLEKNLDLNEYLIGNKAATFLIRVDGDSMKNAGIFHDDLLLVDRSAEPESGKIVLVVLNGEFTIKRLIKIGQQLFLQPENDNFKPIEVTADMNFQVFGVITFAIHKV